MKLKRCRIAVLAALAAHAGLSLTPNDVAAATRAEIKRMVVEEALNSRVPPSLALAVAKVESDFQANALSTAGARGVMQIMPETAQGEFGVDADELWNPRLNIQLGIDYLEQLYDRYGGRWALALSHYNGGTLKGSGAGAVPHRYTRKYVKGVLSWYRRYADQAQVWRAAADRAIDRWRPARSKILQEPPRVQVRELPTGSIVRWRWANNGRLDDFTKDSERVRFPTGGPLDDFTASATWRDG